MARFCDLVTIHSKGLILFERFKGEVIIADQVYAALEPLLESQPTQPKLDTERFDRVVPPYERFWIEAKSTQKGGWIAALCSSYRVGQSPPGERDAIKDTINQALRKSFGGKVSVGDAETDVGWILSMYPIWGTERGGGRVDFHYTHSSQEVLIAPDGKLLTTSARIYETPGLFDDLVGRLPVKRMKDPATGQEVEVMADVSALVMETLLLLNCVNVRQERVNPPEAQNKRHVKDHGVPMSTYKILTVKKKNGDVINLSERSQNDKRSSPREHHVRGHLKMVNGQKYYWQPFMRGNPNRGSVAKTYRVKPEE